MKWVLVITFVLIFITAFSGRTFGASAENKTGLGSIWILFEERIGGFWKEITQALFMPEEKRKDWQEKSNNDGSGKISETEKINLAIPLTEPFPAPVILTQKKPPCQFSKTPFACLFPKKTKTKKENATQNTPDQTPSTKNAPIAPSSTYTPPPAETPAPSSTKPALIPPKSPSATDIDALVNSALDGLEDEGNIINSEDDSDIFNDDEDLDDIENIFDDSDFE